MCIYITSPEATASPGMNSSGYILSRYHLKLLHPSFFLYNIAHESKPISRSNFSKYFKKIVIETKYWVRKMEYQQTAALFDRSHHQNLLFHFQFSGNNIAHSHLAKLQLNELSFVSVH